MNLEQLHTLFEFCQAHDADSEQLLLSYLEQRFPDGWQQDEDQQTDRPVPENGSMSRAERAQSWAWLRMPRRRISWRRTEV